MNYSNLQLIKTVQNWGGSEINGAYAVDLRQLFESVDLLSSFWFESIHCREWQKKKSKHCQECQVGLLNLSPIKKAYMFIGEIPFTAKSTAIIEPKIKAKRKEGIVLTFTQVGQYEVFANVVQYPKHDKSLTHDKLVKMVLSIFEGHIPPGYDVLVHIKE
jgi:hypothetical protein